MNFLNNSSSESMKALTEKVIKADLSSRKRRSVANRAGKMSPILLFPFVYYTVKVNFTFDIFIFTI